MNMLVVLLVNTVTIAATVTAALAQDEYSLAGANPYVARKDWSGLLAYTQAWTRANPSDPMAWYYMGQTYGYGFNQPAQAVTAFRRAVALREQWPEAWHALGFSYVQARHYNEGINAVRRAISQAPDRPNYWSTLAQAYAAQGDWSGTLQILHEEQQHMNQATSYDWFNLGNSYENLGRRQEAIAAYNQSLHMNQNYGPAWNNLGVAEQLVGNDTEAMADYKRAGQLGNAMSP
jgi:predicted Zn-dependent protease